MTTLLAFLVTLAILIVIHELGHYLVARWAGVKVLRFSVGFGKVVASRVDRHGTEWSLSAIPLGGYVKMLDEREAPVAEAELGRAFNRQSLGARTAIVAAGPLANFLLAIALFWVLFLSGVPIIKPLLGTPPAGSPAALAGIQAGDTVLAINGEAVESWQDVHWLVLKHAYDDDGLRVDTRTPTGGERDHVVRIDERGEGFEQSPLRALGLVRYLPPLDAVLGELVGDGAASRAGLMPGDRVLAVDGEAIENWEALVERIRAAPGRPLRFEIERAGRPVTATVVPDSVEIEGVGTGRIGAAPHLDPGFLAMIQGEARYGPVESFMRALQRTWDLSIFSLKMLGRMIVGEASIKNLSGPITIADYAGQSAQTGLASFIAFLALVSLSLGVLNLLPVPLLDGGHLLYYFAEFLTGRPVSERIQEIGQKIGIGLLGLLMFFALYNDLQRLLAG